MKMVDCPTLGLLSGYSVIKQRNTVNCLAKSRSAAGDGDASIALVI